MKIERCGNCSSRNLTYKYRYALNVSKVLTLNVSKILAWRFFFALVVFPCPYLNHFGLHLHDPPNKLEKYREALQLLPIGCCYWRPHRLLCAFLQHDCTNLYMTCNAKCIRLFHTEYQHLVVHNVLFTCCTSPFRFPARKTWQTKQVHILRLQKHKKIWLSCEKKGSKISWLVFKVMSWLAISVVQSQHSSFLVPTLKDLEGKKDRKRKLPIGWKTNAVICYLSMRIADWFIRKAWNPCRFQAQSQSV